jgi:hypothetical protein
MGGIEGFSFLDRNPSQSLCLLSYDNRFELTPWFSLRHLDIPLPKGSFTLGIPAE